MILKPPFVISRSLRTQLSFFSKPPIIYNYFARTFSKHGYPIEASAYVSLVQAYGCGTDLQQEELLKRHFLEPSTGTNCTYDAFVKNRAFQFKNTHVRNCSWALHQANLGKKAVAAIHRDWVPCSFSAQDLSGEAKRPCESTLLHCTESLKNASLHKSFQNYPVDYILRKMYLGQSLSAKDLELLNSWYLLKKKLFRRIKSQNQILPQGALVLGSQQKNGLKHFGAGLVLALVSSTGTLKNVQDVLRRSFAVLTTDGDLCFEHWLPVEHWFE